jgi:signal transduction histidine kinase/DNA-binding response OmpR family regulator
MPEDMRKNPRILVIEDDAVSRNILTNIFRNEGYDVLVAEDGVKGLETAFREAPDLICLDIILPGLSGYEICRSIRQQHDSSDIPILMITALTKREDVIKGLKSGATDYIMKPFSPIEVLARVRVNLQRRLVLRDLLERTDQFKLACETLETTTSSLDLKQVLLSLVTKMAQALKGQRCSIISVEGSWDEGADLPKGRLLVSHDDPNIGELSIDLVKYPEILEAFKTGEIVIINDVQTDPLMEKVKSTIAELGIRSILAVPLAFRGEILGALLLRATRSDGDFTEDEITMARIIAAASTNALRNASLFARIEKKNEQLEQAIEELQRTNVELETLNQTKSDFVSMVSHELRTPLTSIIGFSELLAEAQVGELTEEQEEYTQQILRKGKDLLALINDLLDTGQLESGKLPIRYREMNLETILHSVISSTRHVTGTPPVINVNLPENLTKFEADQDKIIQILTNLVTNALKFSPPGSPVDITAKEIKGRRETDTGDLIQISVTDRGIGIHESQRQKIFDQFYQVETGTSRSYQGAGLGLYICKSFVELHGGKIWVESVPDKGSTFHFTVPIKQR